MHQDLKHRLIAWKNDVHPGETRKVFISGSPINEGEDIIRLEKTLSGTLAGRLSQISASNKFLTSQHPTSDMEHLNSVIISLEKEFNDRYEQLMSDTFENKLKRYAELN